MLSSRDLRGLDDVYVAQNVFINADLSREEEKIAYERRIKRRTDAAQEVRVSGSHASAVGGSSGAGSHSTRGPAHSTSTFQNARIVVNSHMNGKKSQTVNQSNLIICNDENLPRPKIAALKPNSISFTPATQLSSSSMADQSGAGGVMAGTGGVVAGTGGVEGGMGGAGTGGAVAGTVRWRDKRVAM